MEKLNLDISKYSCNELQEIFNINNVVSYEQVSGHFNTYKNTILTDGNLSLFEKDNMTSFLNKVIDKLIGSLDRSENSQRNNFVDDSLLNTYSAQYNNLVKGTSDDHPIIKNQNIDAGLKSKTYEGRTVDSNEFPPGYINPINIKTIKKTVNVDTRFRTPYYSTLSTDFTVSLPDQFKKVVNMRLTSFEIPLTIHSINESYGNNYFSIDSSAVEISGGNYSVDIIPSVLNTNSILTTNDISFSIDSTSGKSVFTRIGSGGSGGSVPSTIQFNQDSNGKDDLDTPLPLKLGWLLGFRAGSYELGGNGTSIISEGICSMMGPKYIYICINDFTNAGNNNFTAAFSSSTLSPHIIARVNYQSLVQSNGVYNIGEDDDFSDSLNRTREYFGPVDIQKLHFQIIDEYGRIVNFNNMDWSCALTFDVLYD